MKKILLLSCAVAATAIPTMAWADAGYYTLAKAVSLNSSTGTAGTLSIDDYSYGGDYFRVNMASAGVLTAYTTGNTDDACYLVNSVGTTVAWNNDRSTVDRNCRLSARVPAGKYYLAVSHPSYPSSAGNYSLYVKTDDHPDDYNNNVWNDNLRDIPLTGTGVAGKINFPEDEDWFRIQSLPSADGTLNVYTTGSTDTHGLVRASYDDTIIQEGDSGGDEQNFKISVHLSSSQYTGWPMLIRVRHNDPAAATGNYTVYATFTPDAPDDHGNTAESATVVDMQTPQIVKSGLIDSATDIDYFRINIPQESQDRALILYSTLPQEVANNGYLVDLKGSLRNADDVEIAQNDDYGNTNQFRMDYQVTPGSVYYVKVTPYGLNTSGGNYNLTAVLDDHGSTMATATLVTVGSSTNGAIKYVGDYDYFRVEVPSNGILAAVTTGSTDTVGYLIGINPATGLMATLASHNNISTTEKNFSISKPVTAGTYYIAVRHNSSTATEGVYTLKVTLD